MPFLEQFQKEVSKNKWWHKNEKVLIAVSGGVDSMALFHLIRSLPEIYRPQLYVAHVNHKLRDVSDEEAQFVRNECAKYQIPFFSATWHEGKKVTQNIEQAARNFRYTFFDKLMKKEEIRTLITAHHKGDQVETVLMRLINGNRINTVTGIKKERLTPFGKVIRPLLDKEKSDLYTFMEEKHYRFYEDATNRSNLYFRNRLRNELLPQLRVANEQIDAHIIQFQEELDQGLTIIEQVINPIYAQCVHFFNERIEINLSLWQTQSRDIQHFMMNKLIHCFQDNFHVAISKKAQSQLEKILRDNSPNKSFSLKEDWFFRKEYKKAIISKIENKEDYYQSHHLKLNEGFYLSEREWLIYSNLTSFVIPKEVREWQKKEIPIKLKRDEALYVRKKKPGDRLVINHLGQTKKISRYFIDEKIPKIERENSWIVEGENQIVKWLLPFRGSYLSIRSETDKIYNKLVYYYLKDESSWRKN